MASRAGENSGAADAKGALGSLPSPLDAIGDMRSAARWMLAVCPSPSIVALSYASVAALRPYSMVSHAFPVSTSSHHGAERAASVAFDEPSVFSAATALANDWRAAFHP